MQPRNKVLYRTTPSRCAKSTKTARGEYFRTEQLFLRPIVRHSFSRFKIKAYTSLSLTAPLLAVCLFVDAFGLLKAYRVSGQRYFSNLSVSPPTFFRKQTFLGLTHHVAPAKEVSRFGNVTHLVRRHFVGSLVLIIKHVRMY